MTWLVSLWIERCSTFYSTEERKWTKTNKNECRAHLYNKRYLLKIFHCFKVHVLSSKGFFVVSTFSRAQETWYKKWKTSWTLEKLSEKTTLSNKEEEEHNFIKQSFSRLTSLPNNQQFSVHYLFRWLRLVSIRTTIGQHTDIKQVYQYNRYHKNMFSIIDKLCVYEAE